MGQEVYTARHLGGTGPVWARFPAGHTHKVSVSFSPDGSLLAAATHARDGLGVRLGRLESAAQSSSGLVSR